MINPDRTFTAIVIKTAFAASSLARTEENFKAFEKGWWSSGVSKPVGIFPGEAWAVGRRAGMVYYQMKHHMDAG